MNLESQFSINHLEKPLNRFWELSGQKIKLIESSFDTADGAPVFTEKGKYVTRGWTEWTQGFQFGSAILQFDATGENEYLELGRKNTLNKMAPHLTHNGVHDHGFNNVSTYGNLLRLIKEGKIESNEWEKNFYTLALKVSGAVQAMRWTEIPSGGFIYSFNGPHSLFVDTIRSCRALVVSHALGHVLQSENDKRISLIERAIQHILSTVKYSIYYGEGRDTYDISGRTAHEIIFNTNDGNYRCPNSQQGYTGFSTWTRGLSWAICGLGETLEILDQIKEEDYAAVISKQDLIQTLTKAAKATADFYLANTPTDGIPYWDTGAPNLHKMGDYLSKKSDPFNDFEPVDSSAACIAAQGLIRIGNWMKKSDPTQSEKYIQAGIQIAGNLFSEPYLSTDPDHQGLILHSIYHQPNGWDYQPEAQKAPYGESCMWGDYHARELALLLQRMLKQENYYSFFNCVSP
ncbi:glycoside hydrolase family 88 protein [Algoriphagus halophytocola]|uniref:Glycoside hydrolase family 88 protein n=1 Tax=Algoriphagus halophytocola TaxID=2991499 RepID=A0ABY6MJY0_9BACT|nr:MULTISPECIES: glycoside hydrolase family 88 protein [unclassified Algoriphagus]UZD22586.1 glycoside hydrolase family 88 protein [Algoriphagus sp. TR-M5]WBL43852.1 glycoside hydrolase family 88 protein [Algoriphagus sp. TR-M9]